MVVTNATTPKLGSTTGAKLKLRKVFTYLEFLEAN